MRGHIRRRGKTWSAVVYLGGKQYQWTAHPTRAAAEEYLAQALGAHVAGRPLPARRIRTKDFLEQWLKHHELSWRASTSRDQGTVIRRHLIPTLGQLPLRDIGPAQIQLLIQSLAEKCQPRTVYKIYAIFRAALEDAMSWGVIPANPGRQVRLPPPPPRPMAVWDMEQVRLFLATARRYSRHWLLFKMAIWTGMRIGELMALRWADLNWDPAFVQVQRQLTFVAGRGLRFEEPKTRSGRRAIALQKGLMRDLKTWKQAQLEHRMRGREYHDFDLIFCRPDGRPYHADRITHEHFPRIIRKAGLPPIRFHDLRHTHATQLLAIGASIKVVQERLGHSRASYTLQTYVHLLPTIQHDAAAALERRLLGRGTPHIVRRGFRD